MFKAGVIGATGYTGLEVVRLIRAHPALRLVFATSESEAGRAAGGTDLRYVPAETAPLAEVDVVFSCLPSGESGLWAVRAAAAGLAAVDLSADLREPGTGAVYGLPELWRDEVRGARLIANPGCYPTGILVGLAPLLRAGLVDRGRSLIIDAASGVTGAGRNARRDLLFGEVAEDYRAYGVGNRHRHVPEIGVGLARLAGPAEFVFTPHLLPIRRGILETIYVPVPDGVNAAVLAAACRTAYAAEPFVAVLDELPAVRDTVGRNVVALGFADVAGQSQRLVLLVAAFDNLLKGAAGQAIQNANLMLGLPEQEGLPQ
ncbi:MAG: N-acetyl-gamma-glutamyl-phosphate reductase [Gemmatimonadetes bacterium]|nr:N-acetyl-gamma-glutamyl-phosphate reductase [Gemmatimonadota bacterium]